MTNLFTQETNYRLCVLIHNMMNEDFDILKQIMKHYADDTVFWNSELKHSRVGQLCEEIIDRDITSEMFNIYIHYYETGEVK